MLFSRISLPATLAALASLLLAATPSVRAETTAASHTFRIGEEDFLLDGKPYVVRCGEMHFQRIPREYWEHRLKMAHAMGLNAVCVYLFWNYHEWEEGKFDWEGQKDAAEFCRLAQKEGLWVILRPGPYSCAEWEMGGLPWWLLKRDGIQMRSTDPKFMEPATRYLKEVGRILAPLQITHGGPILMAQVENEYGSFGKDPAYMGALRQTMLDAGFDVPLFACNPPSDIPNGLRDDLFQVVNFGSGPEKAFDKLKQYQKTGPLMNGEFYPGWFDTWGKPHHTGDTPRYLADLKYMLDHKHSFSIYMAHGGTSFGLWAGADRPFQPDTSSYDYDAPISEAGWVTEKFTKTRELFSKYLQPGETLPEPPAANPVVDIPPFLVQEVALLESNLPASEHDAEPRSMEQHNQGRGCILYRTILPAGPAGTLAADEVHDYAWVNQRPEGSEKLFFGGGNGWMSYPGPHLLGVMDRRSRRYSVQVPARLKPTEINILVEAAGRVNFGKEVSDHKGLLEPVTFTTLEGASQEVKDWEVFSLPLDDKELASLQFLPAGAGKYAEHISATLPAFWRGDFEVAQAGDTFLDVRSWGKGVAWINGHCLGRFWNIGPTQTMYVPGAWLKTGRNQVVVLDLVGPRDAKLAGLSKPILNELHPELDWANRVRATGTFTTEGTVPIVEGSFTPEVTRQDARFKAPAKGRYLCLEAVNTFDKAGVTAVAELDAYGPEGKDLPKSGWKVLWVTSEESTSEDGSAENALNGQSADHWHTAYSKDKLPFPHRMVLDLGAETELGGIRYLPRSGAPDKPGRIKDYRVYLSDKSFGLTPAQ